MSKVKGQEHWKRKRKVFHALCKYCN